jgi:hypothetical protein
MPANVPSRNQQVYFVGAGVSCALGLPNTAALLHEVLGLIERKSTLRRAHLDARLKDAFVRFYPDAGNVGFRPDAVDFFSSLRTYIEVAEGFAGGLKDAADLFRRIKFAIAQLFIERLRSCEARLGNGHEYLDQMVKRGNVVVTSNWDVALELYASLKGVPMRYGGAGSSGEFVILKLHGSIDWLLGSNISHNSDGDFAALSERLFSSRPYRTQLPKKGKERDSSILRVRVLENWSKSWQMLNSRAAELHMVTMARGKSGDLGPLEPIWRDAYAAVSRAQRLEIVGYSMPDDDTEIRTLLRAGIDRGTGPGTIEIRNPSPDVHDRVRSVLRRTHIESNYLPIPPLR